MKFKKYLDRHVEYTRFFQLYQVVSSRIVGVLLLRKYCLNSSSNLVYDDKRLSANSVGDNKDILTEMCRILMENKETLLFMKCPDIFLITKNTQKFYLSYMFFLCIETVIANSINLT